MNWLEMKLLLLKLWLYKLFGKSYVASICGHKAKLFSQVDVFGEKFFLTSKSKFKYCPECVAKMSIRCAWCGEPIKVGDPITLYTPCKKDFQIPEYAVVYKKDPLQLVGCLRWDCADSGMSRAGFWVEPGEVHRVVSPIEMALATEEVVICDDLSDINKTIPLSACIAVQNKTS